MIIPPVARPTRLRVRRRIGPRGRAFRRSISSAGLHSGRADDLMYDGEPEVVLRIEESGVEVVFDQDGRLSSLAEPMPEGLYG